MKSRPIARLLPRLSPPPAQRRSRWPVFFSALILLWCAWWYCREESQGLLFLASGVAAVAVARSRALPGTARWLIWGGVALTVFCLAANVDRLVPPENALEESRAIDRMVTIAFALGLTALLFRPSVNGVTLVAAGGLPMAMVVLARGASTTGSAEGFELLIVWVLVALMIMADLSQRLTQARPAERLAPGAGEAGRRLLFLTAVAALAFGLRLPVESAAKSAQQRLFGWVMYADHTPRRRAQDLLLNLPAPANFAKRMRVVLLVRAEQVPGYLRERVFVRYRDGRWAAIKPDLPLNEAPLAPSGLKKGSYALAAARPQAASSAWRVEVLAPALLAGFCLPGNAVTLTCGGLPPLGDTNGMVAANGGLPDTYDLAVAPSRLIESAYPWPEGVADPAYLEVPASLAGAVSNWVAGCAGLADAPTPGAAIRRVEDHFATNFTYRLGLRMQAAPDPLLDFMSRKEGACALFASSAALMFRSCGLPSRVIGGYMCGSWNPWLKRWVARESEGHAWVEVWDRSSRQWLLADPTPPDGRPDALRKPGKVRWALDLLVAGWRRALAYLRGANFLQVIADIGEALFLFLWQVAWSLPGAVALAGLGAVWWLRRRTRRRALSPEGRLRAELALAMRGLERRSVAARLRRRSFENWSAWLRRVGPELSPERLDELREAVERYQALRYSVTLDEAAARAWLARARNLMRRHARVRGRK